MKKAKELALSGEELFCSPSLHEFLYNDHSKDSFVENPKLLEAFSDLDDYDILSAIKVWKKHNNYTLSKLCTWMINRKLYKVEIAKDPIRDDRMLELQAKTKENFDFPQEDLSLAVFSSAVSNVAYDPKKGIKILYKDGTLSDVIDASDHLNINSLSTPVEKFFVCYPKNI